MSLRKIEPQYRSYLFEPALNSRERRRRLLAREVVPIHCVGGIALRNPDLKYLLRKGWMRIERIIYGTGWARDLAHPAPLRRTPAGRNALESLR